MTLLRTKTRIYISNTNFNRNYYLVKNKGRCVLPLLSEHFPIKHVNVTTFSISLKYISWKNSFLFFVFCFFFVISELWYSFLKDMGTISIKSKLLLISPSLWEARSQTLVFALPQVVKFSAAVYKGCFFVAIMLKIIKLIN